MSIRLALVLVLLGCLALRADGAKKKEKTPERPVFKMPTKPKRNVLHYTPS